MSPTPGAVDIGGTVDVVVRVDTGSNPADTAAAYILFDPTSVHVVSITSGGSLPLIFANSFDNTGGLISYVAGIGQPSTVSGVFTLCTVRFSGIAGTAGTPLTFSTTDPIPSGVAFQGSAYAANLIPKQYRRYQREPNADGDRNRPNADYHSDRHSNTDGHANHGTDRIAYVNQHPHRDGDEYAHSDPNQ